ncbi:hypothetical protein [Paenibacillus tuaregi]|uniref:hypothetical protein n=1 Tax=Paenibacillus tuaregi TaxID=1816681 RepID=UPI000AB3FCAD|nr:hypothetical protein [Paenibacillus tuaregi]
MKSCMKRMLAGWLVIMVACGMFIEVSMGKAEGADKISNFQAASVKGPLVPGIGQGREWVPQGLALVPGKDWMITSHYLGKETVNQPSGIVITNTKTHKRVKTLYLYESFLRPHTGNVGGVAVSREHLWIVSGYTIYKLPLSVLMDRRDFSWVFMTGYEVKHKASYATYEGGVLWVGEYMDGKDNGRTTCASGPKGRIFGYKLNASDDLSSKPVPAYSRSTPDRIQGVAVNGSQIVYSQSCGRDVPSKLLVYSKAAPSKLIGTAKLPPMAEGIAFSGSWLYTSFESAAHKYAGGPYPLKNVYLINMRKLKI